MKLNLGCGFKKLEGFCNVDCEPTCESDMLVDLEATPWPWEDSSVEHIVMHHILEHLGHDPKVFLKIMKELWRVSQDKALLEITVPHPRHDTQLIDPTHVRPIYPETIAMFDQERNRQDLKNGGSETKLGLYLGIDIEVVAVQYDFPEPIRSSLAFGMLTKEDVQGRMTNLINQCLEIRIGAKVHKPARLAVGMLAS